MVTIITSRARGDRAVAWGRSTTTSHPTELSPASSMIPAQCFDGNAELGRTLQARNVGGNLHKLEIVNVANSHGQFCAHRTEVPSADLVIPIEVV
jgi:hypothetical protein